VGIACRSWPRFLWLTSCRLRGFHVASRFELICPYAKGGVRGSAETQAGAWMRADREAVMAPFAHNWRRQMGPGIRARIEDGNSAAITGARWLNIHLHSPAFDGI
jgi:hypothetical protein